MKEYFYTITEGMIELGLRGTELNLFAIIYGYSQKGDGRCYATRRELARRCGVSSTNTIDSAMDSLMEKGLVKKFIFRKDDRDMVAYSYNANFEQGTQKLSRGYAKIEQGGCSKIEHNENINKEKEKNNIPPTPQEVVAYCRAQGFRDPEGFADYYLRCQTELNWKSKSGKQISNWKLNIQQWRKYHQNEIFPRSTQVNKIAISDLKTYLQ